MTDRNGNLNKNSRSGSREDGREPVRRNTAMNSQLHPRSKDLCTCDRENDARC